MALEDATLVLFLVFVLVIIAVAVCALLAWNSAVSAYDWHVDNAAGAAVAGGQLVPNGAQGTAPTALLRAGLPMMRKRLHRSPSSPQASADGTLGGVFDLSAHGGFSWSDSSSSWEGGSSVVRHSAVGSPNLSASSLDPWVPASPQGIPSRRASSSSVTETSLMEHASTRPEDLKTGYAFHFSTRFNGDSDTHHDNVATVADNFGFEAKDICYCFLCFEEVANEHGGSDLKLEPYGTNAYAARIWLVLLARFVKKAQQVKWATCDAAVQPICDAWGYDLPWFISLVKKFEEPFQQKYGGKLMKAFRVTALLHSEEERACKALLTAAALAAPRGTRLEVADNKNRTKAASVNLALTVPLASIRGRTSAFAVKGISYPRELDPAEYHGLPAGWNAIEAEYESGINAGRTWVGFSSEYKKGLRSVRACVEADARHRGLSDKAVAKKLAEFDANKENGGRKRLLALTADAAPAKRGRS